MTGFSRRFYLFCMLLLKSHSNLDVSGYLSNIRIFLEMYLAKALHPSPFRLNSLCLSGFQMGKMKGEEAYAYSILKKHFIKI